jgi:NAD+ diphosphatase
MNRDTYLRLLPNIYMDKTENDIWFVFYKGKILVKNIDNKVSLPTTKELNSIDFSKTCIHHIGASDGHNCFLVEIENDVSFEINYSFYDLRSIISILQEDMFLLCSRAAHLLNWYKNNNYCSKCGEQVIESAVEISKVCPKCNLVTYPRISPAIIVAVIKDNKILLGHNNRFKEKIYSVLAGFVEAGETFEQCVMREVYEESGIKVRNIRYFGSQPWPFPDSLMVAFTAEYAGGEISVDGNEIIHADWFEVDKLPTIPSKGSIAWELIEWFRESNKK